MATTRRVLATRRSDSKTRRRLAVTVTAPDGEEASSRGLGPWLSGAALPSARGEVTVALVSDARMRTLNRAFRGKDYATDVLSFSSDEPGSLGDIVIATGVAHRQADEAGHPVSIELKVLALHGLLHLLGYDHETDKGAMARLEATLRQRAGLEEGLSARHRATTARRGSRKVR